MPTFARSSHLFPRNSFWNFLPDVELKVECESNPSSRSFPGSPACLLMPSPNAGLLRFMLVATSLATAWLLPPIQPISAGKILQNFLSPSFKSCHGLRMAPTQNKVPTTHTAFMHTQMVLWARWGNWSVKIKPYSLWLYRVNYEYIHYQSFLYY